MLCSEVWSGLSERARYQPRAASACLRLWHALDGKSVFCKFVVDCDYDIRARDEVLIVNEEDKLLAYGKSLLSACEIKEFESGQAIKTRKGMKK